MGLASVWLTQGLTNTWYIAWSQCLWWMDVMTIQTIRILPDYCVAWMWHLLLQLAVQLLLHHQNLCQMMVKNPTSSTGFCFRNAIMVRFPWSVHFSTQQKWYSCINTGRMVILGKLVHPVSINPVFSTIKLLRWFTVCQEASLKPDIGKVLSKLYTGPVGSHPIESIY